MSNIKKKVLDLQEEIIGVINDKGSFPARIDRVKDLLSDSIRSAKKRE